MPLLSTFDINPATQKSNRILFRIINIAFILCDCDFTRASDDR